MLVIVHGWLNVLKKAVFLHCLQKLEFLVKAVCPSLQGIYALLMNVTCTWSVYSAIRSRYDDILRESDNLSAILKTPPRRLRSYVYALFTHRDFVLQCMNTPFQEETHIKNTCILWFHRSKLASLWTNKNSNSNSLSLNLM